MTTPHRPTSFLLLLLVLLLAPLAGCAGMPRSPGQLENMDAAAYDDWLTNTVRPWSEAAGTLTLANDLATLEQVQAFTAKLREAAALDSIPPSVVADVAAAVGWDDRRAVMSIVATGTALLRARGGFQVLGPRSREVLLTIAAGVDAGALLVVQGPLQP